MGKFTSTAFDIYSLESENGKVLWSECIYVFDTSALLAFYKLPRQIQISFEKVFSKLKNRLWLPNHVQFEFLRNRTKKVHEILSSYTEFFKKNIDAFDDQIHTLKERIETLDPTSTNKLPPLAFNMTQYKNMRRQMKYLEDRKKSFRAECKKHFDTQKNSTLNMLSNDIVQRIIKKHFAVGEPYSYDKMMDICREGYHRYKSSIPPGYKDIEKEGTQRYGDLVIWMQMLDYAKEHKKSIVFVTNDVEKGDWGIVEKKSFVSPLPDLISEFYSATQKRFWIYTLRDFLSKADENLGVVVPEDQLQQVSQTMPDPNSSIRIIYICNKCQRRGARTIELGDLDFSSMECSESDLEFPSRRSTTTEFLCHCCGHLINANIIGWIGLNGVISDVEADLSGARIAPSPKQHYNIDHWDDVIEDRFIDYVISCKKDG